jgi:hypothetical protein
MKQTPVSNKNVEHIKNRGKCMRRKRRKSTRRLLVGSPVGDRETPEQQGHQCCRGGVRCGGVGERAIAGERERMGGRKEEKEKKKGGEGRVGGVQTSWPFSKTKFLTFGIVPR